MARCLPVPLAMALVFGVELSSAAQARRADPIPPPAPVISDAAALRRVPHGGSGAYGHRATPAHR